MTIEDRLFDEHFTPASTSATAIGKAFDRPATGITIHYTASSDVPSTVRELVARGFGYHLIIDKDGTLYRMASFGASLAHAGKASWRGQSPNARHLAISVVSWGFLEPGGRTFEGTIVPPEERALRMGNITKLVRSWHAATPAQEQRLLEVLVYLVQSGIAAEEICGHDECALPPGRKSDPGGVLRWPMQELRSLVAVLAAHERPEHSA